MSRHQTTFVFVDEDQQNKYSKSTLSVINAQVAKYAHKQRQTTFRCQSAPSSPPQIQEPASAMTPFRAGSFQSANKRRQSDPKSIVEKRRPFEPKFRQTQYDGSRTQTHTTGSRKRRSTEKNPPASLITKVTDLNNQNGHEIRPEILLLLFESLCRIIKLPTYQAFPFSLNLEERRLAHYWFTEVLREDFGMNRSLVEGTFQEQLIKYPLSFQVPLQWVLAYSALRLHKRTGSQSLAVVYRSHERAFQSLQDILGDPTIPADEAIGSIQYSIVHNSEFRKLHLRGLDAMIEARGGLRGILKQCKISQADHAFLSYTFATFDISERSELENIKSQFLQSLLAIQHSAARYHKMKVQLENWASSVDLANYADYGASNLQRWAYTEQRDRLFGPQTLMGRLIRQKFDRNASMITKSRLFGALFQLATLLMEYESAGQQAAFLRQLENSANHVSDACIDPATGLPTIMSGASIFLVGHASRQVQEDLKPNESTSDVDDIGITIAISGIAALKIYGLLPDSVRERLQNYLQSWLLGLGNATLSDAQIDSLSGAITYLWLQEQRSEQVLPEDPVGLPDCYFGAQHGSSMDNVADEPVSYLSLDDDLSFDVLNTTQGHRGQVPHYGLASA